MFANIRIALIIGLASFLALFGIWVNHLYNKTIRLEKENKTLIQTKQIQEQIIIITDEAQNKDKQLNQKVNDRIERVKTEILAKNQEDFVQKSACIFNNFGNENYECK